MTRTEAWRKVAEAFGTPWEERTSQQQRRTENGLCDAISLIETGTTEADLCPIYDQMSGLRELGDYRWWWPVRDAPGWTRRYDAERATFAGLMAAMTQRERNQLVEGL